MISAEKVLEHFGENMKKPQAFEEISECLGITEKEDYEELSRILITLESEGRIILTRKNRYGLPAHMNLRTGVLKRYSQGFAFLIPDNREESDVYIKPKKMNGAMNGDRVIVRVRSGEAGVNKKPEGDVIRIISRANTTVVGVFEAAGRHGFVIPDDERVGTDIFIDKDEFNGARDGFQVVAEILRWPEKNRSPEGRIVEVLGKRGAPGVDVVSIVRKHSLPEDFPAEVLKDAEKIGDTVNPDVAAGRRDLRALPMVTIDGADAKDLDDAVSLEKTDKGLYRLGVHIADVGHYVPAGSQLDCEALKRGTSVYLVDRVIPMLPRKLSNGICSLNAGEDRLAMTCMMEMDDKGNVENYEIFESVIRVNERMTYRDVADILIDKDAELSEKYSSFIPMFFLMEELARILIAGRDRRGSIDFDFPESKVIVGESGKPVEIVRKERTIADRIIEEFMIAANETVAQHYYWQEIPFIYRVHEGPSPDSLGELRDFLHAFNYSLKPRGGEVRSGDYQKIVNDVKGKPEERVINTMLLRSMKHAFYSPSPLGHFGLSSKYYSHFTSPIRRYPDLAIHRIIKEAIAAGGGISGSRKHELVKTLQEYCEKSSAAELTAEEAERESVDMKKAEYMLDYIGEEFDGVISGVTSFGLFVELANSVEGLVHISSMDDDFYRFIEERLMLKGEHGGKIYHIGDAVRITVVNASPEKRQVDFELVQAGTDGGEE